ncbi:hypothetical protein SAMN05216371_5688 [Streptomyces sp. TLI_053]|uniref:hypothetical protein n=1 Tax=Streptomyces sp. TLI_053 TaxID=1855352 RepID=UPI000879C791|nr:hypothetical protein [Streptomyces sp. TLI_053]SDT78314.1 hypothetical protein SAMN05216371_5688 [Streptomyces sp. TLI_053]
MTEEQGRPSNRPHIPLPRGSHMPHKRDIAFTGPSVGSIGLDTRTDGRVGFVHVVNTGVVWLREPGAFERVWDCPVRDVGPPSAEEAEEARSLDAPLYDEEE